MSSGCRVRHGDHYDLELQVGGRAARAAAVFGLHFCGAHRCLLGWLAWEEHPVLPVEARQRDPQSGPWSQ